MPLISALAVGCVAALLIAVLATSESGSKTGVEATSPLQGKPAPEISGPLLGGGDDSLSRYRGKWVVINFFASWCVPCQQEQADLVRFQDSHEARGDAVIFAVRFDDPDDGPIRQLMTKSGGHWPIVDNIDAKIDYGVTGPPESFLVDPAGIVRAHIVGQVTADLLDEVVDQARATAPTSPAAAPGAAAPTTAAPGAAATP